MRSTLVSSSKRLMARAVLLSKFGVIPQLISYMHKQRHTDVGYYPSFPLYQGYWCIPWRPTHWNQHRGPVSFKRWVFCYLSSALTRLHLLIYHFFIDLVLNPSFSFVIYVNLFFLWLGIGVDRVVSCAHSVKWKGKRYRRLEERAVVSQQTVISCRAFRTQE